MAKTPKQKTGIWGEQLAEDFLLKKGYQICEKNWRLGRAEIDLIAKDKNILVFIEVKTRKNALFGNPEDFVGKSQIRLVKTASEAYQIEKGYEGFIRFDIIGVLGNPTRFEILHLEDAF
jgi:putative endonuclease